MPDDHKRIIFDSLDYETVEARILALQARFDRYALWPLAGELALGGLLVPEPEAIVEVDLFARTVTGRMSSTTQGFPPFHHWPLEVP